MGGAAAAAETRKNLISSIYLAFDEMEQHVLKLEAKYKRLPASGEFATRPIMADDAEILLVGYGIVSRVLRSAVDQARAQGMKVGLFRPITPVAVPSQALAEAAAESAVGAGGRDEHRADGRGRAPGASTATFRSSSMAAAAAMCRRSKKSTLQLLNAHGCDGVSGKEEPCDRIRSHSFQAKCFYDSLNARPNSSTRRITVPAAVTALRTS